MIQSGRRALRFRGDRMRREKRRRFAIYGAGRRSKGDGFAFCNVARLIDQLMTLLEIDSRKKSRENKKEYFQIVFWFWGKEEERERK